MDKFVERIGKNTLISSREVSGSTSGLSAQIGNDNQSENSQSESHTNRVKRQKYDQKFRDVWKEKFVWLQEKNGQPFCISCSKSLVNNFSSLQRHEKSAGHKKNVANNRAQPKISEIKNTEEFTKKTNLVKNAELRIIMFIIANNLAFTLISPLIDLIKSVASDSEIAKGLKLGKTKAVQNIKEVILEDSMKNISEILKNQKFSIVMDESTDLTGTKCLAVTCRYFDFLSGKVKDRFLALLPLKEFSAKSIFEEVLSFFKKSSIPLENLIGYAADNAAVMMGAKGGIKKLFQNIIPDIYNIGCTCHSLHLCSSAASRTLPSNLENLARDIYTFISHSPKRLVEFKELQEFFNVKVHKILKTSFTRWLALEQINNRILEQWIPLQYFITSQHFERNSDLASKIAADLNDHNKVYYTFLSYILNITNKLNAEFQSESPKFHTILPTIRIYLKTILSNFLKNEFLEITLLERSWKDEYILDVNNIYIGARAELLLNNVQDEEVIMIKNNCMLYYMELAKQTFKRFDLNDATLKNLAILNPQNLGSSLINLIKIFPNFVGRENELEELDNEWRILINLDFPQNKEREDLEVFWSEIFKMRTGKNELMFPKIKNFISGMLSLPHSSATVERIFSQINLIKNEKRNCLHNSTLHAIMAAKGLLNNNSASEWKPSPELMRAYKK